jgi:hypothetical protein
MKRHNLVLVLFASIFGCGDTTDTTPTQQNLNRPVDVSFSCYGGLRLTHGAPADTIQDVTVTAQPIESCTIRSAPYDSSTQKPPVPVGQEDLVAMGGKPVPPVSWFAFILQSTTGTVALARWSTDAAGGDNLAIFDADPLVPGINAIAVGEDPVAIAADQPGCFQVTANAGSCDLSVLDVTSALDAAFQGDGGKVRVDRRAVTNASGTPVRAKPIAMVAEPAGGSIGTECQATATGLMYIAYPSCHAVAAVDVSTGTIVSTIRFDAAGVPTIGDGNLTCPDECGGGGVATAGTRPVALDLQLDPRSMRRALLIGADNSSSMTLVELGTDSKPASLSQIALEDKTGTLGITNVKLSPQIGMGGASNMINDDTATGGQFQFAYGVANDGTVRVADVFNLRTGAYRECDTQVDPRFIHDIRSVRAMSCFALGDPATPPPRRRAGARGPGVELGGSAVPTSIDVFRIDAEVDSMTGQVLTGPQALIGYYGLITSETGAVFILNIDDDGYPDLIDPNNPLAVSLPLAIGNQLRDSIPGRDDIASASVPDPDHPGMSKTVPICNDDGVDPDAQQGNNRGGPRVTAAPSRTLPSAVVAAEKVGGLPSIHQVLCTDQAKGTTTPTSELSFDAQPLSVRDLAYPDLKGLRIDETWTLTWEGTLSNDTTNAAVDGPSVRTGTIFVDGAGIHLRDATKPFCDAGVEAYDVVQLRGCDPTLGDTDCPSGYRCFVHPQSQVAGLGACMLSDEADRLADACKEYLTSLRRYTVYHAETGELKLLPRKHVLSTTPLDGCVDDNQCQALADYAVKSASSANPIDDKTPPDTHTWSCAVDPDRAVVPGTGKRCIETCMSDGDCIAGTVCQNGACMEGIIPPQSCVNAPQRFDMRAGEAFAMLGTKSGYRHAIIADASGNCVKDATASPYLVGRIPLVAPPCDPTADPRTGALPAGGFEPNPCSVTTDQVELEPVFAAPGQSCTLANPPVVVSTPPRQAQGIKIRTPGITFTIVDPTYPGDALCNGDRGGTLHAVPLVFSGFQLAFRQTAGFSAQVLPVSPSFPIKVVRGPLQTAWIMDDGDFLSTTIGIPSTRGQVFRVFIDATSFGHTTVIQ